MVLLDIHQLALQRSASGNNDTGERNCHTLIVELLYGVIAVEPRAQHGSCSIHEDADRLQLPLIGNLCGKVRHIVQR